MNDDNFTFVLYFESSFFCSHCVLASACALSRARFILSSWWCRCSSIFCSLILILLSFSLVWQKKRLIFLAKSFDDWVSYGNSSVRIGMFVHFGWCVFWGYVQTISHNMFSRVLYSLPFQQLLLYQVGGTLTLRTAPPFCLRWQWACEVYWKESETVKLLYVRLQANRIIHQNNIKMNAKFSIQSPRLGAHRSTDCASQHPNVQHTELLH